MTRASTTDDQLLDLERGARAALVRGSSAATACFDDVLATVVRFLLPGGFDPAHRRQVVTSMSTRRLTFGRSRPEPSARSVQG